MRAVPCHALLVPHPEPIFCCRIIFLRPLQIRTILLKIQLQERPCVCVQANWRGLGNIQFMNVPAPDRDSKSLKNKGTLGDTREREVWAPAVLLAAAAESFRAGFLCQIVAWSRDFFLRGEDA